MKDLNRKCFKCGRSPAQDPNVKLFRFPQPGFRNTIRCELWAKFCFPDKECSRAFQMQLHSEHRMLCDKHFHPSAFIDFETKKLQRHAVPREGIKRVIINIANADAPIAGPSRPILSDITNSSSLLKKSANADEQTAGPSRTVICKHAKVDVVEATATVSTFDPMPSSDTSSNTVKSASADEQTAGPSRTIIRQHSKMDVVEETATVSDPMPSSDNASSTVKIPRDNSKHTLKYKKLKNEMKKVTRLRKVVKKLKGESFINVISQNNAVKNVLSNKLTSSFAVLLQAQLKNTKRKPKGRRWTENDKIIALRLYRRSPAGYRLLRRLFSLPSQTTLKNLLKRLPMDVGPNKKVFEVLKKNFDTADPEERECVLMFDEMSIKKHLSYNKASDQIEGFQDHGLIQGRTNEIATHALVFMISGIRKKFKQPVAYYISGDHVTADRLVALIKEVLSYCFQAFINVAMIICDQDGVNRRTMNILGVTPDKPYFKFENREIVAQFDTPHLLKSFRNLFQKYDIRCPVGIGDKRGNGVASWSHLKLFYDKDNQNSNFVYAPALTKAHLEPNQKQKMKVRLAAQIMSHSVAAGLFALAGTGDLPQAATVTATMVSKIDKLFDAVNADTPDLKKGKPYLTNYSNRSKQSELFTDLKYFFKNLELIGARARPPSLDGWIQSITAIERLWINLKSKYPAMGSLATRRLQQDPLENLFGCIRANCGSNSNPTVVQFVGALKTSILSNLYTVGLVNKNCEDDDCKILDNLKSLLEKKDIPLQLSPAVLDTVSNGIFDDNLPEFDPEIDVNPELQACAYVCGFIVKNIKKKNTCQICSALLTTTDTGIVHMFNEFKEYAEHKKSLQYASNDLIQCIELCATQVNSFLKENAHAVDLFKTTRDGLNTSTHFKFLEKCDTHYLHNKNQIITSIFFICVKRFITIKNRSFADQAALQSLRKKVEILKHM